MKSTLKFFALTLLTLLGLTANALASVGEDVFFQSVDGTRLHALLFKAERPRALLLVAHGMQSHAGWFLSGDELSKNGVTVLAYDRRGSGLSDGPRGHVDGAKDFLNDLGAAAAELRKQDSSLPMHLHANCFATRIAIPFTTKHPKIFKSVIFTSPSTDMAPDADYSAREKFCFLRLSTPLRDGRCKDLVVRNDPEAGSYVRTPLRDELFTTDPQWLKGFVQSDALALREVSLSFLKAASNLQIETDRLIQPVTNQPSVGGARFATPMLLVLATHDRIVNNRGIKQGLWATHPGAKDLLELDCEHGFEFCSKDQVAIYRQKMLSWLLRAN